MPCIFDKEGLRKIIDKIDLSHVQAVFRAKNAHHNERQEEALKCAESCLTARKPVTSSSQLCWFGERGTVDGFEEVFLLGPDGAQHDLAHVLQMLPKDGPVQPSEILTVATRPKRKADDSSNPTADVACELDGRKRQKVAMGCTFSKICFAAVCVENGLAAPAAPLGQTKRAIAM